MKVTSFPTGLVGTMEGVILFTVLGGEILARYRVGWRHGRVAAGTEGTVGDGRDGDEHRRTPVTGVAP